MCLARAAGPEEGPESSHPTWLHGQVRTLRLIRLYRAFHKNYEDATTQVVPAVCGGVVVLVVLVLMVVVTTARYPTPAP